MGAARDEQLRPRLDHRGVGAEKSREECRRIRCVSDEIAAQMDDHLTVSGEAVVRRDYGSEIAPRAGLDVHRLVEVRPVRFAAIHHETVCRPFPAVSEGRPGEEPNLPATPAAPAEPGAAGVWLRAGPFAAGRGHRSRAEIAWRANTWRSCWSMASPVASTRK